MVWGEAGLWGALAPSGSPGQMETCPLNSPFCEGAAPFLSKAHAISPEQTLRASCPVPSPPGSRVATPGRMPHSQLPNDGC